MRLIWIPLLAACMGAPSPAEPSPPAPDAEEPGDHAKPGDHDKPADHDKHADHARHTAPGAKHRFDDADKWSKVFDAPERDAWQKPAELVAALDIQPGATVADLGAGTGYLVAHLAPAVGPKGRVLALEVEPNLVEHMQARFKDQPQVEVRHIGFDGPGLAPASVDLLVMVDVYHHIEDRPAYFASALPALRPGGRLVVVDFIMDEIPVGPPPGHRIAAETVTQELQQAGFAPAGSLDLLPYQFVQIYRVPAP